jgi:hypothetical protein
MALEEIEYVCGHTDTIKIKYGGARRESYIEWAENNKLCSVCYKKTLKKRFEKQNIATAKANSEAGLPPLTGSEKAIAWAETIRAEKLKELLSSKINNNEDVALEQAVMNDSIIAMRERIKSIVAASWWIDQRKISFQLSYIVQRLSKGETDPLKIATILDAQYRDGTFIPPASPEIQAFEADAKAEATVRPEKVRTETVAEININEDTISVTFSEKREDFWKLVKRRLSFQWNKLNSRWERKMNNYSGTVQDRAVELGHKLLSNGFCIRIFDQELRERAIAGQYDPECRRWIKAVTEGSHKGWFTIKLEYDDGFYKVAKKLRGSVYDKNTYSIKVPPEQFEQVLDFSEMYKFKLSEGAQSIAETARKIKDATLTAKVVKKTDIEALPVPGTRPPQLAVPVSVGVADEFKD